MAANDPLKPTNAASTPPRSEAVDSASLPTIDLGQEGMVDLGELSIQEDGSAVPLAQLPEPPSGQSLTSWTEVIRRQRAAQAAAEAAASVEVDAPSDKDLLDHVNVAGEKGTGDTSEIRPADLPIYTSTTSESDIDLGQTSSGPNGSSEVGFDILYPPSDAGGAIPLPPTAAVPIGSPDFQAFAAIPVDDEEIAFATSAGPGISGVDLGADVGPVGESGRSSILDVLLRESGGGQQSPQTSNPFEFEQQPPLPPAKTTMPRGPGSVETTKAPTHPGIDLSANGPSDSDVDLSGPDSSFGSDDEVDLYSEADRPASITDSGTLEISEDALAESQRRAEEMESSSIDLNSRPSLTSSEFEIDVNNSATTSGGSESDIDLTLPPIADEASSSIIAKRRSLDEDEGALSSELESRRPKAERDDDSQPPSRPKKSQREVVPSRSGEVPASHRRGYLLHGGVLGLLLGAGGVLAAYFGGALPDRNKDGSTKSNDDSGAIVQLRQELGAAKKKEADAVASEDALRQSLVGAGIDPEKPGESLQQQVADAKAKSESQIKSLTAGAERAQSDLIAAKKEVTEAKKAEETAKASLVDAEKAAADAKKQMLEAMKAVEIAKADAVAAKKAAEAKLAEATKRQADLAKSVEAAKKAAEDATKARLESEGVVKSIADRLAKAKFVGDQPDAAALVKGLDEAIKAASNDATKTLRDELTKARNLEATLKADLTAAKKNEAVAIKRADLQRAEAQKLAAEATKLKALNEKSTKVAADAAARAAAAEKIAIQAKTQADQAALVVEKIKSDNERLTRELEAVRELAELIKSHAGSGVTVKPDPARLAERAFADGMRSFYAGEFADASVAFRRAIRFRPDDARYHYLFGLSLWMAEDRKGAEAAFAKGRDLEMESRPPSRAISLVLEKIQGPARQAINAYRP